MKLSGWLVWTSVAIGELGCATRPSKEGEGAGGAFRNRVTLGDGGTALDVVWTGSAWRLWPREGPPIPRRGPVETLRAFGLALLEGDSEALHGLWPSSALGALEGSGGTLSAEALGAQPSWRALAEAIVAVDAEWTVEGMGARRRAIIPLASGPPAVIALGEEAGCWKVFDVSPRADYIPEARRAFTPGR